MRRAITYSSLCLVWCGTAIVIGGDSIRASIALAAAAGGGIWFGLAAWEWTEQLENADD